MHRIIRLWLLFLMMVTFCVNSTTMSADSQQENSISVVINEVHYDPDVSTELVEFIELYNFGSTNVNLSGWYFGDGVSYQFPTGTTLSAGGYIIIVQNVAHIRDKWGGGSSRYNVPMNVIFGPFESESQLDNNGETIELCNAEGDVIDRVDYGLGFPWPTVGNAIPEGRPGTGRSIQLVNPLFDNDLGGSWRSAVPTPATRNTEVYAENIPPHIRQVNHSPKQPKSGEVVTITAKVTDSDGVADVTLSIQVVNPGNYIDLNDWRYNTTWLDYEMHDDGLNGDEIAHDDIYTVQIPGTVQVHRRLIRYRIEITDNGGRGLMAPYADDTQPNFAYFVYDGVPPWSGADRPGATPVVEYGSDVMRSLPVYHLISKKSDVETATWFEKYGGSDYKWLGTLVYDGKVYDHITYRARGGVWRYAMGKNMWKFNFNRGHRFQARDDYGKKYKTKWDKLNFSACIQQGSFGQRGEQGMFEALSNKLFNMVGVPTSKTNWVHFRIIDEQYEDGLLNEAHPPLTSSGTQYDGDFWGVYMTLEQMDGRFLDEHDLPDGNLYKMDGAYEDGAKLNNQGPTGATDKSDVFAFRNNYNSASSAYMWGSIVNLDAYYGLYAIYNAVHHGDITSKNHFFYQNPEPTTNEWGSNNLWWQLVWDVDLTWTCYYGSMSDPFSRSGVLNHSEIDIACRNRVREIVNLLFNPEQTNQLIDEFAAVIDNPDGGPSIVDADRAMWDYHWVVGNGAYPRYLDQQASFKAGQGRFYEEAGQRGYTGSFEGMVQVMKDFVVERQSRMGSISRDSAIPHTPTVTATCPSTYPVNGLTFETSPFSDAQGSHTFAAMKWRIAEVAPGSQVVVAQDSQDQGNALIRDSAEWKYFKGTQEPSQPERAWRQIDFDDSDWLIGTTPIGYGESFIETQLNDMRGGYSTLYVRKTFEVTDVDAIGTLVLETMYDDGINIWINGVHVAAGNADSDELPFDALVNNRSESHDFTDFTFTDPGNYLISGTNVVAAQVINSYLSNSSDCFFDIRLTGRSSEEEEPPSIPRSYGSKPGKYEIDAVWENEELTAFDSRIQIPAGVVRVGRTYRVRCRMKDNTNRWSHWSDPVQFIVGEPISAGILEDLRITELMYNPTAPSPDEFYNNDDFEFVELKNIGDENLDLTFVSFVDGITFDFSDSSVTNLGPGEFILVVANEAAFRSRYGIGLSIAGEYTGKLANDGEKISLIDFWNGTIAEFEFNDSRGWPVSPDGGGHSLVPLDSALLKEPDGSLNYAGNWRASSYIGGSPGRDDPELVTNIIINEIMAHTHFNDPTLQEYDSNDWIELYNTTGTSINLHNWYLSDDIGELKKWAIPAVDIAGYGRISFDEITGFHNPIDSGFDLNKAGEEVIFSYLPGGPEDRVVDCIRFKGQDNEISLSRYPDGGIYLFATTPSRDSANTNPLPYPLVIDELMYHPADVNEEYIELYNPTSAWVYLEDNIGVWRLDGAVGYTFPPGTSIAGGGRLIVVGFDPTVETARLDAFVAAYNTIPLTAGTEIVGPWSGNLSNAGERISLERPLEPDQVGQSICWVIVDEVIYSDVSPWPEDADGEGYVLQRVSTDQHYSGNDPANWQAVSPTPGTGL